MPLVVEKTTVNMVLVTPRNGRATVRLVVVVVPVPVGMYVIENALVEPPTDTYWRTSLRPVLTVMPVKVIITVLPMTHVPRCTVSLSVFVVKAPAMRASPDMKAWTEPVTGAVVNVMSRVPSLRMEPAVELNPMTTF